MKGLFRNYPRPKNLDILFFLVFGILLQMTDGTPFTLNERWKAVWDTELPVELFGHLVQQVIKTVLSMIVVVRCVMSFMYVVSAMLVILCLLMDSAPKLMLPWLLIGGIKSVFVTFVEALTGVYVCSAFGRIRRACIEFVISKAVEIIFAAYLWGSVLNIYQDMERRTEETKKPEIWEQLFIQRGVSGRQRARSLLDESTLYKTSCLNNFEFKDVPHIILQMLRRRDEMSSDSLLDPGMMLASVSNMGSFDNLKTSQSLGELGFVDLRCAQVIGLEEDESLSLQDKALKFLKLTWSDVRRAQRNKTGLGNDIYRIEKDTWQKVIENGTHINKPNRARAEVYIREIQQLEPEEDTRKFLKRSFDLKFSWSFFNLYTAKQSLPSETDDEQESLAFREDDDEEEEGREDEEPTPLFMSNIREEVVVDRIRLDFVTKKMKGDSYAQLCKQDYMSVIGPEVFEKATKLKKLTSLSRVRRGTETVTSLSYSTISFTGTESKTKTLDGSSHEDMDQTSNRKLIVEHAEIKASVPWHSKEQFTGNATINSTDSARDKAPTEDPRSLVSFSEEKLIHQPLDGNSTRSDDKCEPLELDSKEGLSCEGEESQTVEGPETATGSPSVCEEVTGVVEKTPPRKKGNRRMRIRRFGKRKSSSAVSLSNGGETPEREKPEPGGRPSPTAPKGNPFPPGRNHQIYFLQNVIREPMLNVLRDLNNSARTLDKTKSRPWNEKGKPCGSQPHSRRPRDEREVNWKSEVLKTVQRRKNSEGSFFDLTEKYVPRKLLEYYIHKNYLLETEKKILLSVCVANGFRLRGGNENVCPVSGSRENVASPEVSENESLKVHLGSGSSAGSQFSNPENAEIQKMDFICRKISRVNSEDDVGVSGSEILESETDFEKSEPEECPCSAGGQKLVSDSEIFTIFPDEDSTCSQGSDEPISLYYSQAADLASPLLDVKRFIYPDHIHYSYKHVKKKGFDVDISGGFPLLVRESLSISTPLTDSMSAHPEFAITRRPMDLSFATTNAFAEWQTNDQADVASSRRTKKTKSHPKIGATSGKIEQKLPYSDNRQNKKVRARNNDSNLALKPEPVQGVVNLKDFRHLYSSKDYLLIEKLLKMHLRFNGRESSEPSSLEGERTPVQISSTQLHSNKGRVNSTYNPALFLHENKTRAEKKKVETQEERTKDMFARLEREALLHSKNVQRSAATFRQT